jgi:hypothetical protein
MITFLPIPGLKPEKKEIVDGKEKPSLADGNLKEQDFEKLALLAKEYIKEHPDLPANRMKR